MKRALLPIMLFLPLFTLAQVQLALDTVSTLDQVVYNGFVASNGDRVLAMHSADGTLVWRADANGTPIWSKTVAMTDAQVIADQADGTLLLGSGYSHYQMEYIDDFIDTLTVEYPLVRLDQNGNVAWSKKYVIQLIFQNYVSFPSPFARVASWSGGSFISVVFSDSFLNYLLTIKLGDQGQVLWQRSFSFPAFGNLGVWQATFLVADANGGVYINYADIWFDPHVVHLLADGSLDWVKTFHYVAGSGYYLGAAPRSDGDVQILQRMIIPGHDYLSSARLTPEGAIDDAHFYNLPVPSNQFVGAGIAQQSNGNLLMVRDSMVISVADNGDVQAAVAMNSHVAGDQRNTFNPIALGVTSEGAVLSGVLDYVHVDLGYTHHRPAIRTIDPAAASCYTTPVEVTHVVVPPNLFTVEDVPGFQADTMSVSVMDTIIAVQDATPITTTNLCNVMIYTGINESEEITANALLNTVAQPGEPFRFRSPEKHQVGVWDISGREVEEIRIYGSGQDVQTQGWSPGIYLLRISAKDGMEERSYRVLVTP
ncbi:MAG: hypothetical protein JST38_10335 [Bacteroidetes bacterium]|nr:hypothetical protein [Bacteroidota bacterium]